MYPTVPFSLVIPVFCQFFPRFNVGRMYARIGKGLQCLNLKENGKRKFKKLGRNWRDCKFNWERNIKEITRWTNCLGSELEHERNLLWKKTKNWDFGGNWVDAVNDTGKNLRKGSLKLPIDSFASSFHSQIGPSLLNSFKVAVPVPYKILIGSKLLHVSQGFPTKFSRFYPTLTKKLRPIGVSNETKWKGTKSYSKIKGNEI